MISPKKFNSSPASLEDVESQLPSVARWFIAVLPGIGPCFCPALVFPPKVAPALLRELSEIILIENFSVDEKKFQETSVNHLSWNSIRTRSRDTILLSSNGIRVSSCILYCFLGSCCLYLEQTIRKVTVLNSPGYTALYTPQLSARMIM